MNNTCDGPECQVNVRRRTLLLTVNWFVCSIQMMGYILRQNLTKKLRNSLERLKGFEKFEEFWKIVRNWTRNEDDPHRQLCTHRYPSLEYLVS